MRNHRREQIKYHYGRAAHMFFYGVISVSGVAVLTTVLNIFFLLAAGAVYVNTDASYIQGETS